MANFGDEIRKLAQSGGQPVAQPNYFGLALNQTAQAPVQQTPSKTQGPVDHPAHAKSNIRARTRTQQRMAEERLKQSRDSSLPNTGGGGTQVPGALAIMRGDFTHPDIDQNILRLISPWQVGSMSIPPKRRILRGQSLTPRF